MAGQDTGIHNADQGKNINENIIVDSGVHMGSNISGPMLSRQVRTQNNIRNILFNDGEALLYTSPIMQVRPCNGIWRYIHQKTKQWLLHKQQAPKPNYSIGTNEGLT